MVKPSFTYLVAMLALTLISSCDNKSPDKLESISNKKKITVGYIPYNDITYVDVTTGEVKGFLVDVLVESLKDLQISKSNIEFVETDWQNFSIGLDSKKFDLSIAGTFNTPIRAKAVNFTLPIFYLGNGAVVRREDDRFRVIDDFDKPGVKIAVVQGEQGYEYAKKNFKNAEIISFSGSDLSVAPLQVKLKKADAALSDQYVLKQYVEKNPEVKDALVDSPYYILPICWAVTKSTSDTTLLNLLNDKILKMAKSGKLQNIKNKYPMIPFVNIK